MGTSKLSGKPERMLDTLQFLHARTIYVAQGFSVKDALVIELTANTILLLTHGMYITRQILIWLSV